ncbi:MAG: CheR family methyltransferase [Microthrixaceae bacterium]
MTDEPQSEAEGDGLSELLTFITDSRAIDFGGYKRTSLTRRIAKRMDDVGVSNYADYRDLLETDTEEFRFLFDTVLINVTSFFRDARAWEYLRGTVVPEIVELAGGDEIRVWSAGCSTGEEAYSLAMVFAEELGIDEFRERVKIYATDLDEDALRQARLGVYSSKALDPLTPELIERYFEATGTSYAFRPEMRRKVIYGRHDITHDAPISRLHLLACRNTLMYFNAETQAQVLDRFHFAVRDDCVLFLGKAEMLLSDGQRFEAISMPHRMFRRRPGVHAYRPVTTQVALEAPTIPEASLRQRQLRDLALDVSPLAQLVVDINGTLVLVNNQAQAMFGIAERDEGRPLRDLEVSYRPVELRSLIERAQSERRTVRLTSLERRLGPGETHYLDVQVQPLISGDGVVLGVDVTFADTTAFVRVQEEAKRASQELETAYEELQSTNEELETTNEELQSSNEELETMNEELRARTSELDEVAIYLESILGGLPTAVAVLDPTLRVRSWNARAADMWGLRPDEVVDTPFFALDFGLPISELRDLVRNTLDDGADHTIEVPAVNRLGRHITCEVTITRLGAARQGVVVSMEDRTPA